MKEMKVFVCETIHPEAYRLLAERAEIISSWDRCGDADALISRALTVGAAEMDRMPRLKVIAVHGTGTDGTDLEEAGRRGITVVNAPHLNANAVAEMAAALLLAAVRKVVNAREVIGLENASAADFQQETGKTGRTASEKLSEALSILRGTELRGKTAGIFGFGAIGTRIAEILGNGFGMRCIAWTPHLTRERAERHGCICAGSPEDLLARSDAVLLAMPLTEQNRDFMNRERFAQMKKGAVLVNVARGGLVDEDALYESLKEGHLGAAACDVLRAVFPESENPLLTLPGFVATPHIGANTDDALYAVGMACVKQIFDVLEGRMPDYPVETGS